MAEAKEVKPEKEPLFFTMSNPCRVTPAQVKYVSTILPSTSAEGAAVSRYVPIKQFQNGVITNSAAHPPVGIVMLVNTDPVTTEDVVKVEVIALGAGSVEEEAPPFEPFEWSNEL